MRVNCRNISLIIRAGAIIAFWLLVYGLLMYWATGLLIGKVIEIEKDATNIVDIAPSLSVVFGVFLCAGFGMFEFISREMRTEVSKTFIRMSHGK